MDEVREAHRQQVKPRKEKKEGVKFNKSDPSTFTVQRKHPDERSCIRRLDEFFRKRAYLPPKDVTHLLVFQSASTRDKFKILLEKRVSTGNFIMEGSEEAMNMFADSMKTGKAVFILRGTGGAADR